METPVSGYQFIRSWGQERTLSERLDTSRLRLSKIELAWQQSSKRRNGVAEIPRDHDTAVERGSENARQYLHPSPSLAVIGIVRIKTVAW